MNLEAITSEPFVSVADLIDKSEWLQNQQTGVNPTKWAFRGQPCDFGNLSPSFQRELPGDSFGTAELIERRLIDAFREHYEKLDDRSDNMPEPSQIRSGYDLRCLSVMQHYEIPTRLLDWTSDFWTAVYFACASEPKSTAELWYYDREIFNFQHLADSSFFSLLDTSPSPAFEPSFLDRRDEELLVELDPQITPRMKQQVAHHTVSANVFADHVPLLMTLQDSFDPELDGHEHFGRLLIDPACKGKTLQFLAEEKEITASTIFPDVVGLGRFLRWQFDSLRTMLL